MSNMIGGDVVDLKIKSIIGFDGATINGLRIHPDGKHLVYPLGNKLTILNRITKQQYFLSGHTNVISAIDISRSGSYLASGQVNHIGFRALVIIWSFATRKILAKHDLHKVRVEAVAFSKADTYLISLGGRDCSSIVVWDIEYSKPWCGAAASKGTQGEATTVCITNRREQCFVTAGEGTLTVWKIDNDARKLCGVDVNVAKLKRTILCMVMNRKDELLYCGTTTGDIIKINLNYHHDVNELDPTSKPVMVGCFAKIKPGQKSLAEQVELYSMGVRALMILDVNVLLVGAGDGTVTLVFEQPTLPKTNNQLKLPSTPQLKVVKTINVRSMVTSLTALDEFTVLVGTLASEIFSFALSTFELKLLITCHTSTIFAIRFPNNFSDVFATASKDDVRIWNLNTIQELLRIKVMNFCCSGIAFSHDGKSLLTGWSDGIIRSFTPLTGRLIYSILNAHNKGVSAIALTKNDKMIISGGCEGQVRLWDVSPFQQRLICTLKEHKGPVAAIHINKFSDEAVTASTDGTCIIWDIVRKCRKQILFANTLFMCVKYNPSGVQILTGGSDRKIAYWEVFDGCLIRELEGSASAGINALDISPDGSMFVTGGNDQIVKVWKYHEGVTTHVGLGHSGVITALTFSPNSKYIISSSASGSIFLWENPGAISDKSEKKDDKIKKEEAATRNSGDEHVTELGTDRQEQLKKTSCCKCVDKCTCCYKHTVQTNH